MQDKNIEQKLIPCIGCELCHKGCPMRIGISGSFDAMNHFLITGNMDEALEIEREKVINCGLNKASECIVCGRCEKVCPKHIKIRDELLVISRTLKQKDSL